jgi:hypothetical protein
MPSENSQTAIGTTAIATAGDTRSQSPNTMPAFEASSRGAPMSPRTGSQRATSRERYSRVPSSSALNTGIVLWLSRKTRSYMPTSAWPVTCASAPTPACRRVTIVHRHAMPTTISVASSTRVPTNPSAKPSFCLLTTGYSATAVPMQARATMNSSTPPTRTAVSGPAPTM